MSIASKIAQLTSQEVNRDVEPDRYEAKLNAISDKSEPVYRRACRLEHDIAQARANLSATTKLLSALASRTIELEREQLLRQKAEAEATIAKSEPELTEHKRTLDKFRQQKQEVRRERQEAAKRKRREELDKIHAEGAAAKAERAALLASWDNPDEGNQE
jgi:hypothetical protein